MRKRGRGRPRKQSVSVFSGDPEFFEIFLPNRISHQVRIPPDFIKNFEAEIPEAVILKDVLGKIWHVDVKQEENGVFFKDGWNKFVNEKNLELGQFMVFRYNRKSASFSVRIFGKDGCILEEDQDFGNSFDCVKAKQEDDTLIRKSKRNRRKPQSFSKEFL